MVMEISEDYIDSQENSVDSLATLSMLLDDLVLRQSNEDFISFVRAVAPTLISDWKMGRHIKVLVDKLQVVKEGRI